MRCPVGSPKPCGPIFSSWQVLLVKWYLSHVLYLLRTNKRQKSSLYHHFQVSVSWSMKKCPGAWWGTRSGHRYYILLFNIPDISSASSSLPVSSLRVNEEGNCSESVPESREPGGEQFQDTAIIFLFSTYMHPALDDIISCVPRKWFIQSLYGSTLCSVCMRRRRNFYLIHSKDKVLVGILNIFLF